MIRSVQRLIALVAGFGTVAAAGCAGTPHPATQPTVKTLIFVPGVFGDGPWYDGLRAGMAEAGVDVETVPWGMPKALFAVNFSDKTTHEKAEAKLASVIDATAGPIDLVGHSAGCGVILGALAKAHRTVDHVVIIAPSVSPGYDLSPALRQTGSLDVFYSDRDTTFLKWRCSTFGGYDGVKTPAAGYSGFTATDPKLHQHPYDPAWEALGNDGGHGGGTAEQFVKTIVEPLL